MSFILVLRHGFRKIAKKNDYIRVDELGDAFRQSGQNPPEDTVKDMIDKANKLKASYYREDEGLYLTEIYKKNRIEKK